MTLQFNPLLTAVFQDDVPVHKGAVAQLFGQVREFVNGLEAGLQDAGVWTLGAVGGTASAMTGTLGFTPDADTVVLLVPPVENSGPVTLAINGGPARAVTRTDNTNLQAGDLKQGQPVMLRLTAAGDWRVVASGLLWSAVMAAVRSAGVHSVANIAGTGAAMTGTLPFNEVPGETVAILVPPVDNTGPVTMKLGSGPVRSIMANDSTNLQAGDLKQGQSVLIRLSAGGVWRVVGVLRSEITQAIATEAAARAAGDAALTSALRDAGAIQLTNIAGTGDAITASLPSWAPALAQETDVFEFQPLTANTVAGPTLAVAGGPARTIVLARNPGAGVPVGYLEPGRRYRLKKYSNSKWVVTNPLQEDLAGATSRVISLETTMIGVQQDIALLETIRSPIPMAATQAAPDGTVTVVAVSDSWPTNSPGYTYEFVMPLGKAAGVPLIVAQGIHTRTIGGAAPLEIQPGDRVRYRPTSNSGGTLEGVTYSPARLQSIFDAIANTPQVVVQNGPTIPARPANAKLVFWIGPDDPGAAKKLGDVWFDLPDPVPPAALTSDLFYIRPTLGSLKSSVVIQGVEPSAYLPVLTGLQYAVNGGAPVALPATSPQVSVIESGLTQDQQAYIQLAASNYKGLGAWSGAKNYTPRVAATFSHPLTRTGAADELMAGTYGWSNVQVGIEPFYLGSAGAAGTTNSVCWAETDVEGLTGTSLFAECEIAATGSVSNSFCTVGLGLNMAWTLAANTIAAATGPSGVAFLVRHNGWSLVRRAGTTETVLASGATSGPNHIRVERSGAAFRGFVNHVEVTSYDLSLVAAGLIDTTKGAALTVRRPSGASTAHYRARNFVAGLL